MNNRLLIFEQFLESFETESMCDYCKDLIELTPLNFWSDVTQKFDCPGGLIKQTLIGCKICSYLLKTNMFLEIYSRPKMRDSIRIATCFRYIQDTSWIRNLKTKHDIKQKLKDYIADQIDCYNDYNYIDYDKDPKAFINFCNYMSLKLPFSSKVEGYIKQEAIPDPELYFFKEGKYKNMNFWLVYQLDKDYLYELRNRNNNIQEPLKTYLKEYL